MADGALAEVRRLLKLLRLAEGKTSRHAMAQRAMLPFYIQAEEALASAEGTWSEYLRTLRLALPSTPPTPERKP